MNMCTKSSTLILRSSINLSKYSILKGVSYQRLGGFQKLYSQQCCCYSASSKSHQKLFDSRSFSNYGVLNHVNSIRLCSTVTKLEPSTLPADYVPPPPEIPVSLAAPPDISTQLSENVHSAASLIEPTFASQGLGGWTPSGFVQSMLEFAHISLGMPWWMTIVVGTCLVRVCLFPLVIKAQQNAAKMNNHLPQMQMLQKNMVNARKSGDRAEILKTGNELGQFMKEKKINPLKQMLVPLAQAPVFISIFFALRKMASLPVESMKDGGLFWFSNLTIPDPYFLTPIITSMTLLVTVEVGADGLRANDMGQLRYVLRAMPIIFLPFMINFPTAIIVYWMTTNTISLGQVLLLRLPTMKAYFNIPTLVVHPKKSLPLNKGFVEGFKDSFKNSTIIKEMEDRSKVDSIKFKQAGIDPIQKTYPYNPVKQKKISR